MEGINAGSRQLEHFEIGGKYGGYQNWFHDPTMKLGGCAAVTACDCCIYLARECGVTEAYPFDAQALSKQDYLKFAKIMKPYLRPRVGGIDTLELYIDGVERYLDEQGVRGITLCGLHGDASAEEAAQAVVEQIDAGLPIPFLLLHHADINFRYYEWHWFLLNGYQQFEDTLLVKAVTYGDYQWLDFHSLWSTKTEPKGGMILLTNET